MKIAIETDKIRNADFEIFVPPQIVTDGDIKAEGIVVVTLGSNGDARYVSRTKQWREWCVARNLALIGTYFTDKNPTGIEGYCKAGEESGEALLWAIREFQEALKIQLEHIPLFLWGFSAGGQFNYEFNAAFPERVGAFVVNKGGIYYTALAPERARRNPGLFFVGMKDDRWRRDIVRGLVSVNRRGDASWALIEEDCAHEVGESLDTGMAFFDQIINRGKVNAD